MTPADFDFLSRFLRERSGLSITQSKQYLVESRLIPLAQSCDLNGLPELINRLRSGRDPNLAVAVIEAMTTNETLFFRDRVPFEELKNIMLPELQRNRGTRKNLRIWSAACSTGQEPYTLAMMLKEWREAADWQFEIVATDLASHVLDRAKQGEFSQLEVQRGLPATLLVKYFNKTAQGFQVKDEIRRMIRWQQLNLFDDFKRLGTFDIVLCRNVLIYFDIDDKAQILKRMHRQIASEGYLMLGAAETVLGLSQEYARDRRFNSAVYRPATAIIPSSAVPAPAAQSRLLAGASK